MSLKFVSRRSVVYSCNGIVCSSQPLACQAGLNILRQGGNAADAAVATAAVLNVTEPTSCGIGGDCFALFYDKQSGQIRGINGSGRAPKGLNLQKIREMGIEGKEIPLRNVNSITVPGSVDAFIEILNQFGSQKMSLQQIFSSAIDLCDKGYPVSEITSYHWKQGEELLHDASPNGNEMLRNGFAPLPGQIMKMTSLGKTFRQIVDKGRDGFYCGDVGNAIVDLIQREGGVMTLEDLNEHRSTFIEPIYFTYPNPFHSSEFFRLWECPPNGQGLVALIALGLIDQLEKDKKILPLYQYEHNSPEYLHILIEVLRLAFADGRYFVSDPQKETIPVQELLSSSYLHKRIEHFHPTQIQRDIPHGYPVHSSDTVYFSVVDPQGNACSMIFSNYAGFGTGAVPKHCGFTLQNRGANFVLEENHPNCLEGGKRPLSHNYSFNDN